MAALSVAVVGARRQRMKGQRGLGSALLASAIIHVLALAVAGHVYVRQQVPVRRIPVAFVAERLSPQPRQTPRPKRRRPKVTKPRSVPRRLARPRVVPLPALAPAPSAPALKPPSSVVPQSAAPIHLAAGPSLALDEVAPRGTGSGAPGASGALGTGEGAGGGPQGERGTGGGEGGGTGSAGELGAGELLGAGIGDGSPGHGEGAPVGGPVGTAGAGPGDGGAKKTKQGGDGGGGGPSRGAGVLSAPRPRYPASARRAGIEGVVRLRVTVEPDGTVGAVSLRASSGCKVLDSEALSWVRSHWKFQGALADGKPVRGTVNVRVVFRLE